LSVAQSAPNRGYARPSSDAKLSSKNVTKDPHTDGVLEPFEELGVETGGFVEVEATGWCIVLVSGLGIRIGVDSLEQTVHHAKVEVEMGIEGRAETMQEAGEGSRRGRWSSGARLPQGCLEGPQNNVQHGGGGLGPVVEVGPETLGNREHKLSHRDVGEDMVGHMGSGLGYAAGPARGT
jgi:hypothetical protein